MERSAKNQDPKTKPISALYHELKRLDSKNDLLKYITKVTSDGFEYVGEVYNEFLSKFEGFGDEDSEYFDAEEILGNYSSALSEEIYEIKKKKQSQKMQMFLGFSNKSRSKSFRKTLVNSLNID